MPTPEHPAIDEVLTAPPPRCSPTEAVEIAAVTFGLDASSAIDLGSERDQTFLLRDRDDAPLAVMKVSNPAEQPATLDMEALAVLHAGRVDPGLPLALPRRVPGSAGDDPASRRAALVHGGTVHWVRAYDVLAGRGRADPTTLDDRALVAWGATTARLGRALRGFIHPSAIRTMPWDVQHAARTRPMVPTIADPELRRMVEHALDRFDVSVAPRWAGLRAQVVHGDLTIDNALVDDHGTITGIVDFGDMSHTALLVDLASVLDSLGTGRPGDEQFRVARLVIDGYQQITPLEADELVLLGDLWAARTAVGIAIASWRAGVGLEEPTFAERYHHTAAAMLDHILATGWMHTARALSGSIDSTDDTDLLVHRRHEVLGPAMEELSYTEPVRVERAAGTWITDVDGRHYLDAYNNVPCVGHAHPRVTEAIARQSRLLNTNLRYLHGAAVDLAERLADSCPGPLDTVFFVNSGSEANDLAWRLATAHTGHSGGLCTAHAYHGVSHAIAPMSPETLPAGHQDTHIERWIPTDTYRRLHTDTAGFEAALGRLAGRGVGLAATILDGVLQSDGVYDLDPAYVQELVRLTRAAGGVWIADEVQGGHGRTGEAMWSFERFGIEPDIVTLGKPMGNGHPVAAVITRREIAERFARDTVFFSTFGGNQVSVAAAVAVLDVLADERVLPRVVRTGELLRRRVHEITATDDRIGDVRGIGLANAIEVVVDRRTTTPDEATAARIRDGLRHRGVLVGTTGPARNVVKVRPPLAFTDAEVPVFVDALAATLAALPR